MTTIFTIPTGSEHWGGGTPDEIENAVSYEITMLTAIAADSGYEVEFRRVPETISHGNQPTGDAEIIAHLQAEIDRHWDTWLAESLELFELMTAAEAGETYGLAEATVRQAVNRGQIAARKSAGTWLIRRADAEARWGGKIRSLALLLASVTASALLWMQWFA